MHRWNASYDSHSRGDSANSHSHEIAQPRKARFHQNTPQIGKITLLPAFVEEPRCYRSGHGNEDEFEREENELLYVPERVNEENEARQYSHSNYLAPPPPNPPRSPNEVHHRGRQRLRYEVDPIQGGQLLHSEHNVRPPLSRSASLPAVQSPSRPSRIAEFPTTPPKARKTRPAPLELCPPSHLSHNSENSTPISPYPSSLLALYSPNQPLSPNSRTRSLPTYSFQASDFPLPEETHAYTHSFRFSPQLSSSSSSSFLSPRASSVSSESSMASFRQDSEGLYAMPTPPLPSAGATRKQRIRSQLSPNVMSREHLFPRYI